MDSSTSCKSFDSRRFRHLERLLVGCVAGDDEERSKFATWMMMTDHSQVVSGEDSDRNDDDSSSNRISSSDDDSHHDEVAKFNGSCVMKKKTDVADLAQAIRGSSRQTQKELSSWGERYRYSDSGQLHTRSAVAVKLIKGNGEEVVPQPPVEDCPPTPSVSKSLSLVSAESASTVVSSSVDETFVVNEHEILSNPLVQLGSLINREDTIRTIELRLQDTFHSFYQQADDQDNQSLSCMTTHSSPSLSRGNNFRFDSSTEQPHLFASTAKELSPIQSVKNNTSPHHIRSTAWTFVWLLALLIVLFPEYIWITKKSSQGQLLLLPGVSSPTDDRISTVMLNLAVASETSPPGTTLISRPQERTVPMDLGEKKVSFPTDRRDLDVEAPPSVLGTKATSHTFHDGHVTGSTNAEAVTIAAERSTIMQWMKQQYPKLSCESLPCRIRQGWSSWRRKLSRRKTTKLYS